MNIVDAEQMKVRIGSEIAYLTKQEQIWLFSCIESEICTPSLSQAQRMHKLSKQEQLDENAIFEIMQEEKPNQREKPAFRDERIIKLIPKSIEKGKESDYVVKALNKGF